MKYTVAQWMLIRQAKIPEDFSRMKLLTEYVASEHETVQVFYHKKDKIVEFWVVWDLNGVIVRIAQAVQVVAVTSAFITGWEYSHRNLAIMKLMFDEVIDGQYRYGSALLYFWTLLGDRMGAGYHPIAVQEWEEAQLVKAVGAEDKDDDEKVGMVSWLLEPEVVTEHTTITPLTEEPDEDVSEDQFSAFADFIKGLDLQDIEDDD